MLRLENKRTIMQITKNSKRKFLQPRDQKKKKIMFDQLNYHPFRLRTGPENSTTIRTKTKHTIHREKKCLK